MPHILVRWSLKDSQIKGLVERPQNREEVVNKLFADFGGKLLSYYYVLGHLDGIAIADFPDHSAIAACMMRAIASGAFSHMETTMLLTRAEAQAAMVQARDTGSTFKPPAG